MVTLSVFPAVISRIKSKKDGDDSEWTGENFTPRFIQKYKNVCATWTICNVDQFLIYRQIQPKNEIPGKNLSKVEKFQKLLKIFYICYHF